MMRRRRRRTGKDPWEGLDRELNPANFRPRLSADVEFKTFTRRSGERYTMLKTPQGPTYVKLSDEERAIVEQMDATTLVLPGMAARVDQYLNLILEAA